MLLSTLNLLIYYYIRPIVFVLYYKIVQKLELVITTNV